MALARAPARRALLENYPSRPVFRVQIAVKASMPEMTSIVCFAQLVNMHLSHLQVAVCLVLPVSRQIRR